MIRAIKLFLIFCLIGVKVQAQINITLNGLVLDSATLLPSINKAVKVFIINDSITVNTQTNNFGQFKVILNSISPSGIMEVSMTNCMGNTITYLETLPQTSDTLNNTYFICDSIIQCAVGFSYQANGPFVQFQSSVSPASAFVGSYFWQFGDGQTSFDPDPLHRYASGGNYLVCLEYLDSTGCHDVFCDSVFVDFDSSGLILSGTILTNGLADTSIYAILFQEGLAGQFQQINAQATVSGGYTFYSLEPGNYLLRGKKNNSSATAPQYWQDGFYWDDGATIILNSSLQQININLSQVGNIPIGPGRISGTALRTDGLPIEGSTIGLEDSIGNLMDFKIPGDQGEFRFDDLPYGLYWLGVDYPGIPVVRKGIRLSPADEKDSANFRLEHGWLISGLEREERIEISPNPTISEVKILGPGGMEGTEVSLYDALGKRWDLQMDRSDSGIRIRLPELMPPGTYFLALTRMKNKKVFKIIKANGP